MEVFDDRALGFTIRYLSSSTGFITPSWEGYPAIPLDEDLYPAAAWLLICGFPHTTNLDGDPNGDGVNLLMAYALDLNPKLNLADSEPAAVLDGDAISLTFFAARPGITYTVETSTDLRE